MSIEDSKVQVMCYFEDAPISSGKFTKLKAEL